MKTGANSVLIKVKDSHLIKKRGKIHMRTDIDEHWQYINHAEVVATPLRMMKNANLGFTKSHYGKDVGLDFDRMPELNFESYQEEIEFRAYLKVFYSEKKDTPYKYSDIPAEVQVGDIVYFAHTVFAKKSNRINTSTSALFNGDLLGDDEGWDSLWRVDYASIYCVVRDGNIIPIASYCLIEPDMETYDDILIPTYYPIELTAGLKQQRPKSEWIQAKLEPEAKALRGFVRHVGSPLKGEECNVKPGDHILYQNGSKLEVMIEKKKYYAIRQHRLLGIIEDTLCLQKAEN